MTELHSVDCWGDVGVTSWKISDHGTLSRTIPFFTGCT